MFTCTLDGNVLQKSYPRASGEGANAGVADYAYDRPLPITAITSDTITINVNQGGNPISDLSTHTFVSGTNAVVTGGNYTHTWSGGTSTAAVISGGNYPHTFQAATGLTPSDAAYNPTTGKLTLTFASAHQLTTDDYVKLDENALSFTCTIHEINGRRSRCRRQATPGPGLAASARAGRERLTSAGAPAADALVRAGEAVRNLGKFKTFAEET